MIVKMRYKFKNVNICLKYLLLIILLREFNTLDVQLFTKKHLHTKSEGFYLPLTIKSIITFYFVNID